VTKSTNHRREILQPSPQPPLYDNNSSIIQNDKKVQIKNPFEPSNLLNKNNEKKKLKKKLDIDPPDMEKNLKKNIIFSRMVGLRDKARQIEYKSNIYDNTAFKSSKFDGRLPPQKASKKSMILSPSYTDKNIVKFLNFSDTAAVASIKTPNINVVKSFDDFMSSTELEKSALMSSSTEDSILPNSMRGSLPISSLDSKGPVLPGQKGPVSSGSKGCVIRPPDLSIFKSSRSRLELKSKVKGTKKMNSF
jgi:hypothetical protein